MSNLSIELYSWLIIRFLLECGYDVIGQRQVIRRFEKMNIPDRHPKTSAAALGRFSAILTAAGELPGHGASLWTFWQSRSQIVGLYGEADASTILNTAEIVTITDLTAVDPQESERWSQAIGQYTALVETTNYAKEGKANATVSWAPQAAPLMTKEDLVLMPENALLVFPNSKRHFRHPILLHKTVAHEDARFESLIHDVPPVTTN